jgi:hypothetical protein
MFGPSRGAWRATFLIMGGSWSARGLPEGEMSRPHADELPPTPTVKPVDPPPLRDASPTTAQLKGDIDGGRTGDKNPVFDPALAPLGTDDEAAGRPPSPFRVALARHAENLQRWMRARRSGAAHRKQDGTPVVFLATAAAIGVTLVAGVWLARTGLAGP